VSQEYERTGICLWCREYIEDAREHIGFPSNKEGRANARLITAAPDLLRELVLAHQTAAYYAEHESDPGKKLAWLQRAKGHAAAIAKAEGKGTP